MSPTASLKTLAMIALFCSATAAAEPIAIGSRLELMVDDHLIDSMKGTQFLLHHPVPKEIVVDHNAPCEGSGCGYHAIFRDGDICRMYYHAWHLPVQQGKLGPSHPIMTGYLESKDGLHWVKPKLGLFECEGSKENNIVWTSPGSHDFTPFRDTNPQCKPEAQYKAVALGDERGLLAFQSPDAIHWSLMRPEPILTGCAFDTENLAFWDEIRGEYRAYVRDFRDGRRDIRTATSKDFFDWTTPAWLEYPGAPKEQLYTNQVKPYYRAPHIFVGFPTRYIERTWGPSFNAMPEVEHRKMRSSIHQRYGTAVTEGLLMTSRDGLSFHRWKEAFLRPGIERPGEWKYGDNYIAWGMIETPSDMPGAPNELSLYATEGYWTGTSSQLRRYTLRIDGFVSLNAPYDGGETVTKPLTFQGKKLVLNFATSAAGNVLVEIQDEQGKPLDGYRLEDCTDVFGDSLEREVVWKGGADVSKLAGKPIRLRLVMKDADLYSLRFR